MGMFKYVTNRQIKNKKGQEAGRLKIIVRSNSDVAEGEYKCPECQHNEKFNLPWKRPFSVKCAKCAFLIRLSKLKDEMKKEKKAAAN